MWSRNDEEVWICPCLGSRRRFCLSRLGLVCTAFFHLSWERYQIPYHLSNIPTKLAIPIPKIGDCKAGFHLRAASLAAKTVLVGEIFFYEHHHDINCPILQKILHKKCFVNQLFDKNMWFWRTFEKDEKFCWGSRHKCKKCKEHTHTTKTWYCTVWVLSDHHWSSSCLEALANLLLLQYEVRIGVVVPCYQLLHYSAVLLSSVALRHPVPYG